MLEWSDDDEDKSALPPSTTEASVDAEAPKQQARESYVRATVEVSVMQTTEVPEQRTEGGAPRHQEEWQPAAEA